MKKFSALAAAVLALAATSVQAQDFILLSTPEDVFNNSTEDVDGAKAEFQTVLADILHRRTENSRYAVLHAAGFPQTRLRFRHEFPALP